MGFFYSQLFKKLPYPTGDYSGRTIVVTGSNQGLGKEAARHYVRLGAGKMILAVRNIEKGLEAKNDIETTINCAIDVIEVWKLDMASYSSVEEFASRMNSELGRVDIFIANAGIAPAKYRVAEDNESSITVNFVSTFLLAALVMPKLKITAARFQTRPTFSFVSSDVHGHTTLPQKSAPDGELLAMISEKSRAEILWAQQYPVSKLLGVFAMRTIAQRHSASTYPVTVNCVNPGLCHSELTREYPTFAIWLMKFLLARQTEVGSRTLVHGGSQGAESHGQYLSDCDIVEPALFVTSKEGKETQERVWIELMEKLDTIKAGVSSNF